MTSEVDTFLAHYGVKGMRWGVRKERSSNSSSPPLTRKPGVKVGKDGSIEIEKGVNIQRLVRSSGKSLPMKDLTYASVLDYDNARYIKKIGGKGVFGGGRDQVLAIKTTKPIKAPSIKEATGIVSEMMLNDPRFRAKNTNMLGESIGDKELRQIRADPTGKTAQAWYHMTNTKLTFDAEFDPDAPFVQRRVKEAMTDKGFNALRDENDVTAGIAKAPVIIFNPETSLKVTQVTDITDSLRSQNKETLKEYKRRGKDWLDSQLYD